MEALTVDPPVSSGPLLRLDARPRWGVWQGLLVIWCFAASYLQFARLDAVATPAAERVNNGAHGNYFIFHGNPYYLFSEDFHLYVTRAQRVAWRGFTGSPLRHVQDERANFSVPLQVGVMWLVAQTGGAPLPYACAVSLILGLAWSVLFVAAYRWMQPPTHPLTLALIVLLTVLGESVVRLGKLDNDFGQWPLHRGLRLATLAWTSPIALASLIAAVSLVRHTGPLRGQITFLCMALPALAAADPWAFLLALGTTAWIGLLLALRWFRRWVRGNPAHTELLRMVILFGAALLLAVVVNRVAAGKMQPDAFSRAGFGPEFKSSNEGLRSGGTVSRLVKHAALGALLMLVGSGVYLQLRRSKTHWLQAKIGKTWRDNARLDWACLWLCSLLSVDLLRVGFARVGIDKYHLEQFTWRRDLFVLFVFLFASVHTLRWCWRSLLPPRQGRTTPAGLMVLLLLSFFAYHNHRIDWFLRNTAGKEFFLTQDQEALRSWLQASPYTTDRYRLATASHELNYLCAYWTNCDLLLPEGFPYHFDGTLQQIETHMAELLKVYRCSGARWKEFLLHRFVWDQWSWQDSRLTSARHGYMYYLLHRAVLIKGFVGYHPHRQLTALDTQETATLFQEYLQDLANAQTPTLITSLEVADRIAVLADQPDAAPSKALADQPELIVVDEVSRFLGEPDLTHYRCEFTRPTLEVWVRQDVKQISPTLPAN